MIVNQPWVVYGQTLCPFNTAIDNPLPNQTGAIGEVAALPYTVPVGKILCIESFGVEAYADEGGVNAADKGIVFVPWIGDAPPTNSKCLHSVYAGDGYNESIGNRYQFKEGTKINIRIMCAENPAQVVGWRMHGILIDA